jgi:hypothetical protein
MKNLSLALAAMLLLAAPLAIKVQGQNPNELPTNLPGATTFAAPPEGFDPLSASNEALADYGFPPRPEQGSDEYASWARAMAASKTRIIPKLEQTSIFHGPAREVKDSESIDEGSIKTINWSGFVVLSGAKTYGNESFYLIATDVVVPVARQAFGACTGGIDFGSSWVGIDGDMSPDVLQAGVEFDAYCVAGNNEAYYSPWYEWYPNTAVRITNLPTSPGDDLYVVVYHTSPTQGIAHMANINTNQYLSVNFTAPAGTKLVGNSAEWITERPGSIAGITTLTNYIADTYFNAIAYTEKGKKYYPGSSSSKTVIMLDNNGKEISFPTHLGNNALLVEDEGSAE